MSRNYSKVILIGNIENEFELRKTNLISTSVTNLVLTTTDSWEKDGEIKTYKKWHHIVCWGKLAEFVVDNFKKDDKVVIEGSLSYRFKDDSKKFKVAEIKASSVRMWDGSFNKVILIGNVNNDLTLNKTTQGISVSNFIVTTVDRWKNKNNEVQYHKKYHKLVCWNKLAEFVYNTVKNGALVLIEGNLSYKTFVSSIDGTRNNHVAEIKANQLTKWSNPLKKVVKSDQDNQE
jgi:single-strand DNA-binding protein